MIKMNKIKVGIIVAVVLAAIIFLYKICFVSFEDKNMAKVIAFNLNKDNPYFITRKDLDKITHIGIGPTNNYDTIVDLAKCKNLKVFVLNDYDYGFGEFFFGKGRLSNVEDEEKVEKIQNDLKIIFKECPNITSFRVPPTHYRYEGVEGLENFEQKMYIQFTDISFLEEANNLDFLSLEGQKSIADYSVLDGLMKLEIIYLNDSNISDVSGLINRDSLRVLSIVGTPACEEMMKEENQ